MLRAYCRIFYEKNHLMELALASNPCEFRQEGFWGRLSLGKLQKSWRGDEKSKFQVQADFDSHFRLKQTSQKLKKLNTWWEITERMAMSKEVVICWVLF